MVDLCSAPDRSPQNEIESNFVQSIPQVAYKKNPYIPVYYKGQPQPQAVPQLVVQSGPQQTASTNADVTPIAANESNDINDEEYNQISKVSKRSVPENETIVKKTTGNQQDIVEGIQIDDTEWTPSVQKNDEMAQQQQQPEPPVVFQKDGTNVENPLLHFHVTYWMFYPYSQGKQMCTLSLGPLGRLPIPLIFGLCLGTRKDFGSHVGDWEHMTLYFKGRSQPEVSCITFHKATQHFIILFFILLGNVCFSP